MSGFYGADETDVADVRALTLATRILSTRMVKEIREDAQLVYSIAAGSRPGTTYPGFGLVSAASPTDPAKVPALVEKVAAMYAALAKDGVTEDELDVAKKQIANTLDEQMREPGFWLGRMARLTFRGTNLDDVLNAPAAYQALTADAVRAAFAKYYSPARTIVVVVKPEEAPSSAP
jgi:zinc protease